MADKSEGPDSADAEKTGEKSPQSDDNATNETIKSSPNVFKNDGSFLEMFKKKLEEEKQRKQSSEQVAPDSSDSSSSSTTTDETKTSRLKDDVSKTAGNSNETEQKEEKAEATAKKKYSLLSHVRLGMAKLTILSNFIFSVTVLRTVLCLRCAPHRSTYTVIGHISCHSPHSENGCQLFS